MVQPSPQLLVFLCGLHLRRHTPPWQHVLRLAEVIRVEGTEEQRRKNQTVLQLLQTWRTTDAQEQAETWTIIKSALEENCLSDRPLFQ